MSPESNNLEWRPNASFDNLRLRATILQKIRQFFFERKVLEVETPVLGKFTITDRHIASLTVPTTHHGDYFLQTSPEYAMKRLLSAGSGCIYQICKAFRAAEIGQRHNPEFTLLEWYRINFNHFQLMTEINDLITLILNTPPAEKITYAELFNQHFNFDIHHGLDGDLKNLILQAGWLNFTPDSLDRDTCLQLLMSHTIEPNLGHAAPLFVYDFPKSQAALARLNPTQPNVAERFELYIQGFEIANGFHELSDPQEQEQRFLQDQQQRHELGEPIPIIDPRLLAALKQGLPDCAGVALGIDRLIMLAAKESHINQVIAFNWQNS